MAALGTLVFIVAWTFGATALFGLVFRQLWSWFVIPLWPETAPVLSIAAALGLALFLRFATLNTHIYKLKEEETSLVTATALDVFIPLGVLLAGWIYFQFT